MTKANDLASLLDANGDVVSSALDNVPANPTLTSLGIPNHDDITVDGSGNVDVTGNVTSDGLTVDGAAQINAANPNLVFFETDTTNLNAIVRSNGGQFKIQSATDALASTDRVLLDHATGDISFYSSDGLSQGFFWDASTQRLGLGNTSPVSILDIRDSDSKWLFQRNGTETEIKIISGTNEDSALYFGDVADNIRVGIRHDSSANALRFMGYNNTERMRIDSVGNVGIGTSPDRRLQVKSDENDQLNCTIGLAPSTVDTVQGGIGVKSGGIMGLNAVNTLTFNIGGSDGDGASEVARIDISGNLLVSKYISNVATVGFEAKSDGAHFMTRDSGEPLKINRLTNGGNLIAFAKDGSTVGSIGYTTTGLYVQGETAHSGFRFGGNQIIPFRDGADTDNTTDLGASGVRLRNIYVGGGVYLGGTGAANKLDDYEEGNWSPESSNNVSNPLTVQGTGNRYTKIGRQVIAYFDILWNAGNSSTASATIVGLPFLPSPDHEGDGAVTVGYITGTAGVDFVAHCSNSLTQFTFFPDGSSGSSTYAQLAGRRIAGYVQYYTNA